jgi:Imm-5 like putative immunity protein
MATEAGDFELTMDELRAVARFVVESPQELLPVFEAAVPGDGRPRAAVDAAWKFVNGTKRTKLQRVTSLDAHRAAREAGTEVARLPARSAGDAASAAYLHPIANADQVGSHPAGSGKCRARRRAERRQRSRGREHADRPGAATGHAGPGRRPFPVSLGAGR